MIWLIRNILLAFSSDKNPAQIAFGSVIGLFLGLCPMGNIIWFTGLLSTLLFRINLSIVLAFFTIGSILNLVLYGLIDIIGVSTLSHLSFQSFFESMYNTPIVGISEFNSPAVMGSFVFTVLSSIFLIPLMLYISKIFRNKLMPYLEKFWIIKALRGSKLYQIYTRIIG